MSFLSSTNVLLIEANHRKDLIQLAVIDSLPHAKYKAKHFYTSAEFTLVKLLFKKWFLFYS